MPEQDKAQRFSCLYRMSTLISLSLIFIVIIVKLSIWPFALTKDIQERYHKITVFVRYEREKYATKFIQQLFNNVNYLLTPAFTIYFATLALRLVDSPRIFEE